MMRMRSFAYGLALLLVPAVAAVASAQTADAVVEKYLAATGGREALGKLTSRKLTGTATVSTPGGDVSGPIEIVLKAPNKSRVLMTLDLTALGGGSMTVEQRFDGTNGYLMNSQQGESEITGNQLQNMRNNLFPTPLLVYKQSSVALELQPGEKIDGKDAVVLLVTPKSGSAVRMFFDAATSLLVRTIATVDSPQGGQIEQTSDFSDYRAVDGIQVPFHIVNSTPVQSVTFVLSKIEHNVAIDDAMFVK